jgi:hypothetical protein
MPAISRAAASIPVITKLKIPPKNEKIARSTDTTL